MNYIKHNLNNSITYLVIFNILLILTGFVCVLASVYAIFSVCGHTLSYLLPKK
jgi:hypothetical protein